METSISVASIGECVIAHWEDGMDWIDEPRSFESDPLQVA
jgi:hypothetical protein